MTVPIQGFADVTAAKSGQPFRVLSRRAFIETEDARILSSTDREAETIGRNKHWTGSEEAPAADLLQASCKTLRVLCPLQTWVLGWRRPVVSLLVLHC